MTTGQNIVKARLHRKKSLGPDCNRNSRDEWTCADIDKALSCPDSELEKLSIEIGRSVGAIKHMRSTALMDKNKPRNRRSY